MHVFGLWEEARAQRGRHRENMHAAHRRAQLAEGDLNPRSLCCEATLLTTTPNLYSRVHIDLSNITAAGTGARERINLFFKVMM